ncbi:pyrimidine regulatory protein PyrR [Lyngbya sp. PCC 8106]|nr:pyrimidine regulatory protein PyrR [Lyngbya sp. PCC 8106]
MVYDQGSVIEEWELYSIDLGRLKETKWRFHINRSAIAIGEFF